MYGADDYLHIGLVFVIHLAVCDQKKRISPKPAEEKEPDEFLMLLKQDDLMVHIIICFRAPVQNNAGNPPSTYTISAYYDLLLLFSL